MATDPGILRRSAVEAFGCPFRYQKLYLEDVDDSGDESIRGRVFHVIAHAYILRLAAAQTRADHDEAKLALQDGIRVIGCPDHLIHHVDKLFFRWAEHFELDLTAFLSAEELQQSGNRVFRPDLVYCRPQEIEIIDFKTYFKGLTAIQARQELQLRWYLVEAMKAWPGFSSYRFTYEFVRLGYTVSISFTPEEIRSFEPGLQGSIDAVTQAESTGEFPAIPGSHCTLCRLDCPIVDNPAKLPIRVTTSDQATMMAGRKLVLEQELKTINKALSGWVNQEGPLVVNGQVFKFRENIIRKYPAQTVMTMVASHYGDDSTQLRALTFSSTAIKRADPLKSVRDHPDLLLTERRDHRWSFVHTKAGAIGDADKPDDEDEGDEDDSNS